ncbi:MAG: DUF86 domain-containing protein [Chloroflexi bacterium]|nr:DUF86 domain-containing protein [Chloroflexota bacterium]
MPVVDDITRIKHIVDASTRALQLVSGRKRSALDQDDVLGLALVRLLEIVGEAAWGVTEAMRSRYPEVPWRKMSSMRNRLIHGYFDVNLDVVWDTVTKDLPPLVTQLENVLNKETK